MASKTNQAQQPQKGQLVPILTGDRGGCNGDEGREFNALAERWRAERPRGADVVDATDTPAYRAVIAMGHRAIGPILKSLRNKPEHWFIALHQITGENPVPVEAEGTVKKMTEAWLQWGRERGYVRDVD